MVRYKRIHMYYSNEFREGTTPYYGEDEGMEFYNILTGKNCNWLALNYFGGKRKTMKGSIGTISSLL